MNTQSDLPKFQFTLRNFSMREVYGDRDQVRPVLEAQVTGETTKAISEIYKDVVDPDTIDSADLAKLNPPALRYAAKTIAPRDIPGGWESDRVAFVLGVGITSPLGTQSELVIAGYTDRLPNRDGAEMDWNGVTFHINSITYFRGITVGNTPAYDLRSHHVLRDGFYTGLAAGDREYRVRPEDVFTALTTSSILEENPNVFDARTMLSGNPVLSDRGNELPSIFLSKVLGNYQKAKQVGTYDGRGDADFYLEARRFSMEAPISNFPVLRDLTGGGRWNMSTFTMWNLQAVLPEVTSKSIYVALSDRPTGAVLSTKHLPDHLRKEYASLEPGSYQDQAIVQVGHGINALMASFGYSRVILSATNDTSDGKLEIKIAHVNSMLGKGETTYEAVAIFKSRFVSEVLTPLSFNDEMSHDLDVDAQLYDETKVALRLDGGQWYERTIASYADALLSPMTVPSKAKEMPHLEFARGLAIMLESLPSE